MSPCKQTITNLNSTQKVKGKLTNRINARGPQYIITAKPPNITRVNIPLIHQFLHLNHNNNNKQFLNFSLKFDIGCVMQKGPGRHDTWFRVICILKSSAKNGGSNWVLIQGAIFTVSIVISRLLSSGPFSHDAAHIITLLNLLGPEGQMQSCIFLVFTS